MESQKREKDLQAKSESSCPVLPQGRGIPDMPHRRRWPPGDLLHRAFVNGQHENAPAGNAGRRYAVGEVAPRVRAGKQLVLTEVVVDGSLALTLNAY